MYDERVARVEVHESKTAIHVLLVTEPNPAAEPYITRDGKRIGCGGVGINSRATITLKAPLGDRTLYDDAELNPVPVPMSQLQPASTSPTHQPHH